MTDNKKNNEPKKYKWLFELFREINKEVQRHPEVLSLTVNSGLLSQIHIDKLVTIPDNKENVEGLCFFTKDFDGVNVLSIWDKEEV